MVRNSASVSRWLLGAENEARRKRAPSSPSLRTNAASSGSSWPRTSLRHASLAQLPRDLVTPARCSAKSSSTVPSRASMLPPLDAGAAALEDELG
jgi:hypothetical protein